MNCKNCNETSIPEVDNSSVECCELVSDKCVVTSKAVPCLQIGKGDTISRLFSRLCGFIQSLNFLTLKDTPATYAGSAGKVVMVNENENGLEFSDCSCEDGNGIASTADNEDGTFTFTYDDGSTFTTSDLTGPTGTQGPAGLDGNGIASTADNEDGTFTFTYDDGSTFTTPDLTGPQGECNCDGEILYKARVEQNGENPPSLTEYINNTGNVITTDYTSEGIFALLGFPNLLSQDLEITFSHQGLNSEKVTHFCGAPTTVVLITKRDEVFTNGVLRGVSTQPSYYNVLTIKKYD